MLLHRKTSTSDLKTVTHCCPNTYPAVPTSGLCLCSCPSLLTQLSLHTSQLPNNMCVGRGAGFGPSSLLARCLPWRQDIGQDPIYSLCSLRPVMVTVMVSSPQSSHVLAPCSEGSSRSVASRTFFIQRPTPLGHAAS